jgi:hypothetical protein
MAAPYIVRLREEDFYILVHRIDPIDLPSHNEAEFIEEFTSLDCLATLNNKILVHSTDIDYIIKPLDEIVGYIDEVEIIGCYIGIDPVEGLFILQDNSGVIHTVTDIAPYNPFDYANIDALKLALRKMRNLIDDIKEAEMTPDFKENLEGNLEEIYAVLDTELGDETPDV